MAQVTEDQATRRTVANSDFLRALAEAAPEGSCLWVTCFPGNPDLTDHKNWFGKPYTASSMAHHVDQWLRTNTYFSVAALVPTADGEVRRRKKNFARLLALVADDVILEDVHGRVSYVLQTSPGKTQVGILLDGEDPDCTDLALVDRLVTSMTDRGLIRADSSGNNAVRYVRLPVGQNQKPRDGGHFDHQLQQWNPGVRLSLADAAAAFGLDLDELRRAVREAPPATAGVGAQDENLRGLVANVIRGDGLHESINRIAASLVATGMPGGAAVNVLRGLMDASAAPRDERFLARFQDIPRSVTTAQEKFARSINDAPEASGDLPLVYAEAIAGDQIAVAQLVEDVLTQGGLSVIYGESNSGKSFLACDMACSIGAGIPWLGKRTVRGAVLYVAGEGSESIKLRVLAWRQKHNVHPRLAVVPVAVNLLKAAADAQRVVQACQVVQRHYGEPVSLIVIDTLARAFAGGNENASEDMSAVIGHADLIRAQTRAHVMFIHHSGKDSAKGSRGHSSLKAATDTEIEVTGEEATKLHTADIKKQRDLGSRGEKFVAKFSVVKMGMHDQWGKPVTTCVVDPTDERPVGKSKRARGTELELAVCAKLKAAPHMTMLRKDLVEALATDGFTSSPIYRAIGRLVDPNGPHGKVLEESTNRIKLLNIAAALMLAGGTD